MPVQNEFIGANKTIKINGKFILAADVSRSQNMDVNAKPFIQGTIKNRILEVKGVSETLNIKAPILIGGGSLIDGRTLLNTQIENVLLRTGASLPLLENATVTVSETEGTIQLQLMSDGAPTQAGGEPAFQLLNYDSSYLTDGVTSDVLNPLTNTPTRIANFLDFRVNLGGFKYYVLQATITVKATIDKKYFIAGKDGTTGTTGSPSGIGIPDPNTYNFGTQYPWLAVAGIEVNGKGKAAVLLVDENEDYYFGGYGTGESINYDQSGLGSNLTLQRPGYTNTVDEDFAIEVFDDPDGDNVGTWVNLFAKPGETTNLLDLSRSMVTRSDLQITPGIITADFEFYCYVI